MPAVRYRSEWSDADGQDWRIDIIDTGYSGSIDENLVLQAEGCNLNWAGATKVKFSPILTSELTVNFIIRDATEQQLLHSSPPIQRASSSLDCTNTTQRRPPTASGGAGSS